VSGGHPLASQPIVFDGRTSGQRLVVIQHARVEADAGQRQLPRRRVVALHRQHRERVGEVRGRVPFAIAAARVTWVTVMSDISSPRTITARL